MKNKKGFTLIELLAVIVVLGLLMAIAIPSVTKYITESRKKTTTTTLNNYISAVITEVNDLEYIFTEYNIIYAVPIECVSLERGGTNPFGEWHQANNNYWAYVLVQYDDENSRYQYGFTFKDSAGYGMYPKLESKIKENGEQIKVGLDLNRPISGSITSLTSLERWKESGFQVDENTNLQVLVAETEGITGDGKKTCTLQQKGDNYEEVEIEKSNTLINQIKKNNNIINATPTLNTTSQNSGDQSGLYASSDTSTGNVTYYFRGNVTNNNVKFANMNWKIVRINEDQTIRLVLDGTITKNTSQSSQTNKNYLDMYYSNSSKIKPIVDEWYKANIKDKGYESYVATSTFCEQAKVKFSTTATGGSANMEVYTAYNPTFKCQNDANGKGILNSKVGLMTYDEVVFAGGYPFLTNSSYYLNNIKCFWTMTPAGFDGSVSLGWLYYNGGLVNDYYIYFNSSLRPVINIIDYTVTGSGTTTDPYKLKTN